MWSEMQPAQFTIVLLIALRLPLQRHSLLKTALASEASLKSDRIIP